MVDVRRLEEAKRVAPELERLTIREAADPVVDAEALRVERDREGRADELRSGGVREEAVHPAVLVPLPVEQRDVGEAGRVEYL